jgi:hypothetical protein
VIRSHGRIPRVREIDAVADRFVRRAETDVVDHDNLVTTGRETRINYRTQREILSGDPVAIAPILQIELVGEFRERKDFEKATRSRRGEGVATRGNGELAEERATRDEFRRREDQREKENQNAHLEMSEQTFE